MKPKENRIDYPEGSETPADAQPLPDNEFIPPPPPSLEYEAREQEWTDGKEAPAEDPHREKLELAAKIREQAAVLAITARLAEKKGLSVKISLETPQNRPSRISKTRSTTFLNT